MKQAGAINTPSPTATGPFSRAPDSFFLRCGWLLIAAMLHQPVVAQNDSLSAEERAWLEAEEPDTSHVNEGELEIFLTPPAGGPFHHHQNRLTVTPESLSSGWVGLEQCHDHLDRVPRSEIAFRQGRARNLRITEASGIGKAWVEAHSVQLEDIVAQARLCLSGELKLISRLSDGRHILESGPYMRRFLDGYYPMKVSLSLLLQDVAATAVLVAPKPQNGLRPIKLSNGLQIESLFSGRLLFQFELTGTPLSGTTYNNHSPVPVPPG